MRSASFDASFSRRCQRSSPVTSQSLTLFVVIRAVTALPSASSSFSRGCQLSKQLSRVSDTLNSTDPNAIPLGMQLTYAAARDALVKELRANALDHEAQHYDAIGRRFDRLEHEFPIGTAPELGRLHIALAFWDGWIDARNNGWPRGPIGEKDWPALARSVANDLEKD